MIRFALRHPHLIVVLCLMACVVGATSLLRMPVDLFPQIRIPVVVVATFFSGMPPEQIENDITGRFERFFTLGSGIDHIESRSLPGVSLIKIYFQPGTDPDTAVSSISNLAAANLRRLPPGTLPPVVLKFDASSLPVCLITLKGEGLDETKLRDLAQYAIRNQVAGVPGASVPQPFGGRYRQIMVYVDPLKLEAHQLGVMDVVRTVNDSNLILPAGDVRIGHIDYNIYANSQLDSIADIAKLPLKISGVAPVTVGDVALAQDSAQIQNNIVHVDRQRSVYLPVLKQGNANTISVVDGIRSAIAHLRDVPEQLKASVVCDQSSFIRHAIANLTWEVVIGVALTSLLILAFLGSARAMAGALLAVPVALMGTFLLLSLGGGSVNLMIIGGIALVFGRLISNSVIVLENIHRHLEMGEDSETAALKGADEVSTPVLAATLTTAIVFSPVVLLYGVSKYLFSSLALAVVLALGASYLTALTVIPLYCSRVLSPPRERRVPHAERAPLRLHRRALLGVMYRPRTTLLWMAVVVAAALCLWRFIGESYFPRTEPGQFVINLKAPTGTRLEKTEEYVRLVEKIVGEEVSPRDLGTLVANIGVAPGFSSIYTSNSGQHTAVVQCSLANGHVIGSYEYMERIRRRLRSDVPELSCYFQSGGLVDSVVNLGLPAPIDVQVGCSDYDLAHSIAVDLSRKLKGVPGVEDVLIPQDVDYPSVKLDVDRERASQFGLTSKEVVSNVITALTSNQIIAPSYWVDSRTGNDYLLTVQYPEGRIKTFDDLGAIPIGVPGQGRSIRLGQVAKISYSHAPTEVDHQQLRKVIDIYVSPRGEDLGVLAKDIERMIAQARIPDNVHIDMRGAVQGMRSSFKTFSLGIVLSLALAYLILVAQFRSFSLPWIILLAVPPGLAGALALLWATRTTVNIMSLMGVVMMVGIVVSNSILIVDEAERLLADGSSLRESILDASFVRLRPIVMTSLATIIGMLPLAAKIGTGSEAYSPLALAIIGGVVLSLAFTLYAVPAAYVLLRKSIAASEPASAPAPAAST